ncbi:MAG: phosphoglycerate kinase, partial [Acidimicrobiia bacterium]|nr:phosphoglycerate kinase [Acidimicrobiia bacterium]
MGGFLTLDDVEVTGKRVLVRSDLNVPVSGGAVADDFRIRASLPTIARLREAGATVVVGSHLGRPKDREPEFRMDPVAARLAELGGFPVQKLDEVVGAGVEAAVASIRPYDIFARLGGDEFVLFLPATDRREALGAVTRIRRQLAAQ